MALSPEEFVKRLDAISESDGVPYGRAHLLFDEEQKHQQAILQYKGYLSGEHTMADIARHFGVHYSTVSRVTKRFEKGEIP